MSDYNYASFPLDMSADEFGAFADLSRAAFMDGLLKIGDRAAREFVAAVENAEGEAASRPLREWWASVQESRAGARADD